MSIDSWDDVAVHVPTPKSAPLPKATKRQQLARQATPTERTTVESDAWGIVTRSPVVLPEMVAVGESRDSECWRCGEPQREMLVAHDARGRYWESVKCRCRS